MVGREGWCEGWGSSSSFSWVESWVGWRSGNGSSSFRDGDGLDCFGDDGWWGLVMG